MIRQTLALYRTSFSGLSKETWILSAIMLVNRSGTMVLPFLTLYLTGQQMNRSLSEAGFVMALFGFGSIVGAYFGGKFTDTFGTYKVQLFALCGGGGLFICLGQIQSYPLICVNTFLLSLVNEAFRPANSAAVAQYSSQKNLTRSNSLNRLAINFGWAIGGSVGGFLASIDYEWLFWVDGLTNLFAAVILAKFLNPVKTAPKHHESQAAVPPNQSAHRDKIYLWFIVFTILFGFCFFQMFTTIPKYFRDSLHLSETFIGILFAVNGLLIVFFEMVLVFILEKKERVLVFISLGTLLVALSFFLLMIPGNAKWITFSMIICITVGEIVAMPFMNTFWINRTNSKNRGQYAALYTIAWGIGQTTGPFLCAMLVDQAGFNFLFAVLGASLLIAAFGFSLLKEKKPILIS